MILAGTGQHWDQAVLLSIPRDLWVPIPGVGDQRINSALVFGHDPNDPEAGPRLAKATVAQQFNLPVDRYLILDFQTFVRLVDALGGIQVDVPQPITDTQYPTPDYGVTTIHFDAGPQAMNGQEALIYVRTRHADSDFGRSQRQQQVLSAIAAKMGQPSAWPRLSGALRALAGGIQTDAKVQDLPMLLPMMVALAQGRVTMARLDGAETQPWITPAGAWVLLPNWPAIQRTVFDLFGRGS
jgi:LCP family protein required for cell wall assembly